MNKVDTSNYDYSQSHVPIELVIAIFCSLIINNLLILSPFKTYFQIEMSLILGILNVIQFYYLENRTNSIQSLSILVGIVFINILTIFIAYLIEIGSITITNLIYFYLTNMSLIMLLTLGMVIIVETIKFLKMKIIS